MDKDIKIDDIQAEKSTPHKAKDVKPRKNKPKPPKAEPIAAPSLPLLLCAVSFAISLAALITDRFIHQFGHELLSPVIMQIIAVMIPAYMVMLLIYPQKKPIDIFRALGFGMVRAGNIFFIIFASLFATCAALSLTLIFGGSYSAANGMTLLGTFTAGKNEFSYSYPYLIFTYALLPAIFEEIFFRGVIFKQLEGISFPYAALFSATLYAMSCFSLGGLVPTFFVGMLMVFIMYTTKSLFACIAVHLLFNLYRLFLEANVTQYYLSSSNNTLLIIAVAFCLLVSSLLFISESIRIFRARSAAVAEGRLSGSNRLKGMKTLGCDLRATFAYKPSIVLASICAVIFAAAVIINVFS